MCVRKYYYRYGGNMNRINSITPCSFQGKYNYTVYGKKNKHIQYLYNQVRDVVAENKVPSTFFVGPEDKIVLTPSSKKSENVVVSTLKQLGINFSKEAEK